MGERLKASRVTAAENQSDGAKVLSHQVVDRILELVKNGNLKPGDRLPPERELIDIFSISRPSLREALRSLATLGVVEARHGGGAFISDLNAQTLLAPLEFFLSLSKSTFIETFESRRVIEVELVRRAATRVDRADLLEFDTMLAAHGAVINDPIGFRILDSRFHDKLYRCGGNAIMHRMADGLYNMGLEFRRRATEESGAIAKSIADHHAIVEAFHAGNADAAGAAMSIHIDHIEDSTLRMIEASDRSA